MKVKTFKFENFCTKIKTKLLSFTISQKGIKKNCVKKLSPSKNQMEINTITKCLFKYFMFRIEYFLRFICNTSRTNSHFYVQTIISNEWNEFESDMFALFFLCFFFLSKNTDKNNPSKFMRVSIPVFAFFCPSAIFFFIFSIQFMNGITKS